MHGLSRSMCSKKSATIIKPRLVAPKRAKNLLEFENNKSCI